MLRLKGETADLHARVEAAFGLSTRADYVRYLSVMADMHDAYDDVFRGMPAGVVDGRLGKGARARADLRALGETAARRAISLPPLDAPEALGALYVLEGASLGGRVLLRRLRERLGDDLPASYLEGYGRDTGSMWRALTASLERHATAPGDADRMVAGASQCFARHLLVLRP